MRVIVSGSRHATAEHHGQTILNALLVVDTTRYPGPNVLVHGAAPGVDRIAADIVTNWGWTVEPYPANWDHCTPECPPRHQRMRRDGRMYCPTAGHRRNEAMCAVGADLMLAFPGPASVGTWDAVRRAARHGIPTRIHPLSAGTT
jgi:hypothetical protein